MQPSSITIHNDLDVVTARSSARNMARTIGFHPIDQARVATVVSELARNMYLYAGTGSVSLLPVQDNGRSGIELTFQDSGPGIENAEHLVQDNTSMTQGLPAARRLMDEFEIDSRVGVGTTIVCRKWCG